MTTDKERLDALEAMMAKVAIILPKLIHEGEINGRMVAALAAGVGMTLEQYDELYAECEADAARELTGIFGAVADDDPIVQNLMERVASGQGKH